MGAALEALAPLEIAVRGGGAALAGLQLVRVHGEAHRAARLTPQKAGLEENLVQAFRFRLLLHEARARHDHRVMEARRDRLAGHDFRHSAHILDAAIGAGADPDDIEFDIGDLRAGGEAHIGERALLRFALEFIGDLVGIRHRAGDGDDILGRGAPGDDRRQVVRIERHHAVEMGAFIGFQRRPIGHRLVPVGIFRGHRTALEIGEGLLIRRDQAGARASFDRHVADRHPPFHRKRANGGAGIFDHRAGATGGADLADDRQHDILGGDALAKRAIHLNQHVLGFFLDQRLRGEHMLYFRGADAMRKRPEGAMRRGVAVPADDGGARQGEALFRADHMHDALALVALGEILHAEFRRVLRQCFHLNAAFLFLDALGAIGGRYVVIHHGERLARRADLATGHAQAFEGLGRGDLMHEMAVNIEKAGAIRLAIDHMIIKNLVVERLRCGGHQDCPSCGLNGLATGEQEAVRGGRWAP